VNLSFAIDLRSDTVGHPTDAMKAAMMEAPLGDDVLGDDPTVRALEARCAQIAGKEAALFVPSGTMANLLALRVNTQPGDEVILHEDAHPLHYESGGAAHVAGVMLQTLPGDKGFLDPDRVRAAIRPDVPHSQPTGLLWVEDTTNRGGGAVHPVEQLDALAALAKERGLATHLDGARQWNAAVASGEPIARRVHGYDTVSMCFSKGLGCPAGSILCGTAAAMHRARRFRKMLGGAMRQSGMLAAAALYALEHHVERLADDHQVTRELAMGLMMDGWSVVTPETNLLYVDVPEAAAFVERLEHQGVRCFATGPDRLRMVVHMGISRNQVDPILKAFAASR
jgi:threonine aldolase